MSELDEVVDDYRKEFYYVAIQTTLWPGKGPGDVAGSLREAAGIAEDFPEFADPVELRLLADQAEEKDRVDQDLRSQLEELASTLPGQYQP